MKLALEKEEVLSGEVLTQRLEQQGPMMVEQQREAVQELVQLAVVLEQISTVELLLGRHIGRHLGKHIAQHLGVLELLSSVNSNRMERRKHLLRPMPSKQREQRTVIGNRKKTKFQNVHGILSSTSIEDENKCKMYLHFGFVLFNFDIYSIKIN